MMKRVRKPAGESGRSAMPQQSQFASRPFAPKAVEPEAPVGESRVRFSLVDIDIFPRETVQPKLRLGPVGDRYEQEADRVASRVVGTISSPDPSPVQRQEDLEDEDELDQEEDKALQRKVSGFSPSTGVAGVGPEFESSIHRARSKGMPLSDGVRQPMERAFGADFGGVRVHADGEADRLNRSIQARAFTTGQDVFLRLGEYRPRSSEGQRLLAHELTHVVQQNGGAIRRSPLTQKQLPQHLVMETPSTAEVVQREEIKGTLAGNQTFAIQDNRGRIALSGTIYNKIRESILQARQLIAGTIAILGGALTPAQTGMLRIAFGLTTATQENIIGMVINRYQSILDGLNTNGLVIKDESADLVNQGIQGHVDTFMGFRYGPIHTNFSLEKIQITFNLIHEGSHLWANTNDILYMRTDWSVFNTLWGIHLGQGGIIDNFQIRREIDGAGHQNADSFAIFAFGVNGRGMP
jgi:hypothetical protein